MKKIKIKDFGKDHWSTLAYIETCVIDKNRAPDIGEVNKELMRCNYKTHPHLLGFRQAGHNMWENSYGTKLSGYWKKDGTTDPKRKLSKHDDWDCCDDLEEEGLIEVISLTNGFIRLTKEGREVCNQIREHKAKGKYFYSFKLGENNESNG